MIKFVQPVYNPEKDEHTISLNIIISNSRTEAYEKLYDKYYDRFDDLESDNYKDMVKEIFDNHGIVLGDVIDIETL